MFIISLLPNLSHRKGRNLYIIYSLSLRIINVAGMEPGDRYKRHFLPSKKERHGDRSLQRVWGCNPRKGPILYEELRVGTLDLGPRKTFMIMWVAVKERERVGRFRGEKRHSECSRMAEVQSCSNSQRKDVPPDEVCRDLVSEEAVGDGQPPKNQEQKDVITLAFKDDLFGIWGKELWDDWTEKERLVKTLAQWSKREWCLDWDIGNEEEGNWANLRNTEWLSWLMIKEEVYVTQDSNPVTGYLLLWSRL